MTLREERHSPDWPCAPALGKANHAIIKPSGLGSERSFCATNVCLGSSASEISVLGMEYQLENPGIPRERGEEEGAVPCDNSPIRGCRDGGVASNFKGTTNLHQKFNQRAVAGCKGRIDRQAGESQAACPAFGLPDS